MSTSSDNDPDAQAANYLELRKKEIEALHEEYKNVPLQKDDVDDIWANKFKED